MKLRVLLADDHQMFRDALRIMLEMEADLEVVAETGDGLEVVRLARETTPDIVCMDIGMPGMNGIDTTRRLLAVSPSIRVIALSAYSERSYVVGMLDAGAMAYVTKAEAGDELVRAIQAVRQNRTYLCPDAAATVMNTLIGHNVDEPTGTIHRLGPRERQVLQLLAEGHSSGEIAAHLNIAQATVDVHRRNIMRKLDLHCVADLTRYAIRIGLVSS
jgi:two-component system NarL family response regulator